MLQKLLDRCDGVVIKDIVHRGQGFSRSDFDYFIASSHLKSNSASSLENYCHIDSVESKLKSETTLEGVRSRFCEAFHRSMLQCLVESGTVLHVLRSNVSQTVENFDQLADSIGLSHIVMTVPDEAVEVGESASTSSVEGTLCFSACRIV